MNDLNGAACEAAPEHALEHALEQVAFLGRRSGRCS